MQHTFTTKIAIKTSPSALWDALTSEQGISRWFLSKAKLDVKNDGAFTFYWGDVSFSGKFLEVIPEKKLTFSWFEPVGKATFELEQLNDTEVGVTLTASGYGSDAEGLKLYVEETKGWTFFLVNLKVYLEHNLDLRDTNPTRTCQNGWLNSSAG